MCLAEFQIMIYLIKMYLHHLYPQQTENMQVEVRLRGGVNQSNGRVEIGLDGAWGTVCDNNWDIQDARVVCHMLGYPTAVAATLRSKFARGIGRMWLDNVGCTGREENISLCPHWGWGVYSSSCSHSREAGVICGGGFGLHKNCISMFKCKMSVYMVML